MTTPCILTVQYIERLGNVFFLLGKFSWKDHRYFQRFLRVFRLIRSVHHYKNYITFLLKVLNY